MSDVLGKDIEVNDIVIYAKREGSRQIVGIGIVIDPNYMYGRDVRVRIVPLSSVHAKSGMWRVGYNLMSAGTPVTHLNDYQIMVIPNKGAMPPEMIKTLEDAVGLRERALASAEESREANKKLTPSQRFNVPSAARRRDIELEQDDDLQDLLKTI